MHRSFALLAAFAFASCGGPSPSPSPAYPSGGAPRGDMCAVDTRWFASVMGEEPRKILVLSLDVMRRNRAWGTELAKVEPRGQFPSAEFAESMPSFEEIYVFAGPPPGEPGEVVIVRKSSGREPCTLQGSFQGQPTRCRYGAPATLPSGVREFPANPGSLFVFADGTWVRVAAWMAPRFRAAFSSTAASPPAPAPNPSVALQACAIRPTAAELAESSAGGPWMVANLGAERAAVSYVVADAEPGDADAVFVFASPADAARAEASARAQCSQGQCPNLFSSSAQGPIARYRVRLTSPFR